jgi:hypothetical protein
MTRTARGLASAAVLALSLAFAFALPSCGGGSSGTTPTTLPPTTTVPPCTQTVLYSFSDSISARTLVYHPFTTAQAGRVDLLIDWTFPDSHIGVYMTPASVCRDTTQFNTRNCGFLIQSEDGPKPRKVSAHNVPAGSYDVLVANFATQKEATSAQGFLRSENCPAFSAVPPVANAKQLGEVTAVVRGE